MSKLRSTLGIFLIAMVAMTGGFFLRQYIANKQFNPEQLQATVFPNARPLPEFRLDSSLGKTLSNKDIKGQWTFMFFGYTYCPDICPTAMSTFQQMLSYIPQDKKPRVVFVSVDPKRDTPERLREYLAYFNKDFIGLTGSKQELSKLTDKLGIVYLKVPMKDVPDPDKNYLIDHTGAVILLDPNGDEYALWGSSHNAATLADEYQKIVAHSTFKGAV